MAWGREEFTLCLTDNDRSNVWPIDAWIQHKASVGRQPEGGVDIEVPRRAWWVAASNILDAAGGPGAMFHLESRFRAMTQPLSIGLVQASGITYSPTTDTLRLSTESIWSRQLRGRLTWDGGVTKAPVVQYTGKADNVARQIMRDHLTSAAIKPVNYPEATRDVFGGLTVVVEANTGSSPDTIVFDVDAGRNTKELLLELADKFGLRYGYTISGATMTMTVACPYRKTDVTFGVSGKALVAEMGNIASYQDDTNFSAIRNIWCLRDDSQRSWQSDPTSIGIHGNLEDVMKLESGGGVSANTMLGYELADQLRAKDPVRAVAVALAPNFGWLNLISAYGIGDYVSVGVDAIGVYSDYDAVGLEVSQAAGQEPVCTLHLNERQANYAQDAWRRPGPKGGYGAGSRWVSLSG